MTKRALAIAALLSLAGCVDQVRDLAREPALTPVGAGLRPDRVAILNEPPLPPPQRTSRSLWQDTSVDLFRDPRAMRVGDVVTVKISIRDKATSTTPRRGSATPSAISTSTRNTTSTCPS